MERRAPWRTKCCHCTIPGCFQSSRICPAFCLLVTVSFMMTHQQSVICPTGKPPVPSLKMASQKQLPETSLEVTGWELTDMQRLSLYGFRNCACYSRSHSRGILGVLPHFAAVCGHSQETMPLWRVEAAKPSSLALGTRGRSPQGRPALCHLQRWC